MMGATIIGTLLLADGAVVGAVPAERIKLGKLPDGIALSALLVRTVSVIERLKLKRTGRIRFVDRVAVTVRAANYRDQVAIMKLLPTACAGKTGAIAGGTSCAVTNAGIGPDLIGPGDSFEQTIDFRVSYETAA